MYKKLLLVLILGGIFFASFGQLSLEQIRQLKELLRNEKKDSAQLYVLAQLASGYRFSNIDSSLFYTDKATAIAESMNFQSAKAQLLTLKGSTFLEAGKLPESLQFQYEALKLGEKIKDTSVIAYALNGIGNIYMELADYGKANQYYFSSKDLFQKINNTGMFYNEVSNIGNVHALMQIPDSALYYQQIVYNALLKTNDRDRFTRPEIMYRMGNAYKLKGDNFEALKYYQKGIIEARIDNDVRGLSISNLSIAELFKKMNYADSSLLYAYRALQLGVEVSFRKGIYDASVLISEIYKNTHQYDSAFKYLTRASVEKDSLIGTKRFQQLQRIVLDEQENKRAENENRVAVENKRKQNILLASIGVFLIIAIILYRNNQLKKKTNKTLEITLKNLESTQSQLIQSEKMASLGELTAGIAHEIQNPLNFVNNFSEINTELIDELESELSKGNLVEVSTLAKDIKENESKINHHGKRADSIVKGMLQHSRSSTGQKELTDINQLCDEYLRLAYHGLRAKDKSFNANFEMIPDASLQKMMIGQQEIGRVILNLINNAFYAVSERRKKEAADFIPFVKVSTTSEKQGVKIVVEDNGTGMAASVQQKIFQPFYTTKPTGLGTGLGLSLSYDIIQSHGGTIKVESKEGEGTMFIIFLPTNIF